MRWGFGLLALACWQTTDARPEFTLELTGAVALRTAGRVEHGSTGNAAESWYTITLGGRDGAAAVVFTRRTPIPSGPGRYLVGEGQLASDGFSALIITGPPSHPTGVFQVQHGVLRLVNAGSSQLSGEFELHAAGFLSEAPEQDEWAITARGRFNPDDDRNSGLPSSSSSSSSSSSGGS